MRGGVGWAVLGGGVLSALILAWRRAMRGRVPTGPGAYVQSLHSVELEELRRWIERDGFRHFIVQALWQTVGGDTQTYSTGRRWHGHAAPYGGGPELDAKIAAIRSMGAEVWPFGFAAPGPGMGATFARLANEYREMWGSPGVIVDAENEQGVKWTAGSVAAWCDEAFPVLRRKLGAIGVTTLAVPWFHPSFPFSAWAEAGADFAQPQTYYIPGEQNTPLDYPARSLAAFRAMGFRKVVGAAFSVGRSTAAFLANAEPGIAAGFPGVTVWRAKDLSDAQARAFGNAFRSEVA